MSVLVIPEDFRKDRYIPKPCETLPGNISECGTLADAMDWLRAECTPEHPLPSVVMDTGIATEANLAWLREQGLKQGGNNPCWASIRDRLRNWVRITTTLQKVDRAVIAIRQDVWPPVEAADIARRVGVKPACHGPEAGAERSTESPVCWARRRPGEKLTTE